MFIGKLTNINPVSYTDVIYIGQKDTVLVSTYSGRIAKIIKGKQKEEVVGNINDEIYALAYNKSKGEIIASTLSNGLIIFNSKGEIVKKIPIPSSWSNHLLYSSENFNYLATQDQKGVRYIFDIRDNYKNIATDTLIPKGRFVRIDKNNILTIATSKKVFFWNLSKRQKVKEYDVESLIFEDHDGDNSFLSLDFNKCNLYDASKKSIAFSILHPNWPLPNPENEKEIFEIPLQMQINAGRFAKNYIYTGGIDRTVRVWDKSSGSLITTLQGHRGSISKIKVADNQTQVVSIDLKGGIKFWTVE